MEIINVPEATAQQRQISAGEISFVDYYDKGGPFRNRVMFNRYAFSFVRHGEKRIYRAAENTVLRPGYGMLIPEGHSIMAEHSETSEPYNSVIVFFPGALGREFIAPRVTKKEIRLESTAPYIYFPANAYINEYLESIRRLISAGEKLSEEMARLKVNEILIAMYELAPELLSSMFDVSANLPLHLLIEKNLFNHLTLGELAFLANRSLSSFKRDFEKAYGLPPQKYIREKKLELACAELARGRHPGELYVRYGYENLSNFNTAFKRKYGIRPSAYRQGA